MIELRTVREINAAIRRNEQGQGGYVFAQIMGITMNYETRIYQAKLVKGSFYVRRLDNRQWFAPFKVWQVQRLRR
jgi:hypothetical protein